MTGQFEALSFWLGWFLFTWTMVGSLVGLFLVILFGEEVYGRARGYLEDLSGE